MVLTLTFDDGTTFTTDNLTGPKGLQGIKGPKVKPDLLDLKVTLVPQVLNGIASSANNGDGTFTLTFDDGTTFTTDDLTGPQGQ